MERLGPGGVGERRVESEGEGRGGVEMCGMARGVWGVEKKEGFRPSPGPGSSVSPQLAGLLQKGKRTKK